MNAFINAITDPRLLFMWFSFIFLALASLLLGMVEHWPWGAIFFVGGPVTLLALDMAHDESIAGKANGGPFHRFFIFVFSFSAVGLIVLTVLTAFGVLKGDTTPWTPETNFASWYIAAGSHIVLVLATRTNPKNGAPDLQRMEQLDRRSTRVGVVTAAIFGSSPVEWCNRFVSFGVGYALSWSGGSSCWVGWGVSRDLVRMSRLR